jgi:hypothetical protein
MLRPATVVGRAPCPEDLAFHSERYDPALVKAFDPEIVVQALDMRALRGPATLINRRVMRQNASRPR